MRNIYRVTGMGGGSKRVDRATLERLRMLADWQLRQLGYDPAGICAACRLADDADAIVARVQFNRDRAERDAEDDYRDATEAA